MVVLEKISNRSLVNVSSYCVALKKEQPVFVLWMLSRTHARLVFLFPLKVVTNALTDVAIRIYIISYVLSLRILFA